MHYYTFIISNQTKSGQNRFATFATPKRLKTAPPHPVATERRDTPALRWRKSGFQSCGLNAPDTPEVTTSGLWFLYKKRPHSGSFSYPTSGCPKLLLRRGLGFVRKISRLAAAYQIAIIHRPVQPFAKADKIGSQHSPHRKG